MVIGGSPDGTKATVAAAVDPSTGLHAGDLVKQVAAVLGGGGGGSPEVAVAGGRDTAALDAALDEARRILAGG